MPFPAIWCVRFVFSDLQVHSMLFVLRVFKRNVQFSTPPVLLASATCLSCCTSRANCVGWIAYSFVIEDTYVFVPNEIGFMLGAFYTLSCYGLLDTKVGRQAGRPSNRQW